jgi:hypothetical protein
LTFPVFFSTSFLLTTDSSYQAHLLLVVLAKSSHDSYHTLSL